MLHEYCKHRVKVMSEFTKLVAKYSVNKKGAFYIESTIAHPDWKKQNISLSLHSKSIDIAGHKELVILEGMMPKHVWDNTNGCGDRLALKSVLSYTQLNLRMTTTIALCGIGLLHDDLKFLQMIYNLVLT